MTTSIRKPSPRLHYLLGGRVYPSLDSWFAELESAEEMLALTEALMEHLAARRKTIELARDAPRNLAG